MKKPKPPAVTVPDEIICAAYWEFDKEQPDACDLIDRTATKLGVRRSLVMDALEREAAREDDAGKPAPVIQGLRPELLADVAGQFERMEQPLSMSWMMQRNVTLEEVQQVSREIAALLRIHTGTTAGKPCVVPSETTLGARQNAASEQNETTREP